MNVRSLNTPRLAIYTELYVTALTRLIRLSAREILANTAPVRVKQT